MIKEIKYGGFTANPADHEAPDGDLAVALNLIPEDGTVKPVLQPKAIATIPGDPDRPNDKGRKVLCIHKTSAFEHYIVAIMHQPVELHPHYWYLYWWDGTSSGSLAWLGTTAYNEIYNVEPVGNTLVVLTDNGVHYYLWKSGAYQHLGTHLPELDIQFTAFGVMPDIRTQTADGIYEFELIGEDNDRQFQKVVRDKNARSVICEAAMAALNATFRGIASKKLFMFPFFVRYAYRMYDGSLTMHSAPILIALPNDVPPVKMMWEINDGVIMPMTGGDGRERFYGCKVYPVGYVLCKRAVDAGQLAALEPWSDIITKVSIFISPQFYTYEMDAKNDDIIIGQEITRVPAAKGQIAQISNNANFYLAAEYDINKINDASNDKPWSYTARDAYYSARNLGKLEGYTQVNIDFEPTNDNIVVRQAMTDDYQTHDELLPATSSSIFAYNGRINLANVSRRLFNGFAPCCLWFDFDEAYLPGTTSSGRHGWATGRTPSQDTNPDYSAQSSLCTCTVVVKTNDMREIVMTSRQRYMYFYEDKKILWFYYPDENATRAYFDIDGDKYEINLKKHSMLYGAYFFSLEEGMEQKPVQSIPAPSSDEERLVPMPNKIYTSEVNNPFFFPATGINTVGNGKIIGIRAAVKAMSQGQFGQFPLYAFTTDGVWSLQTNERGGYSAVHPVSRDVCLSADSITQLDDAVIFATTRGIMLISGSQVQCVSDVINDGDVPPDDGMAVVMAAIARLNRQHPAVAVFRTFLQGIRFLYDYRGQRIIAFNPEYSYAYIYSLQSHKWGMMQTGIDYGINSYPDAMAVYGGKLINFSEPDTSAASIAALLVTRPLTLELPDVLKTVRRVIQRGTMELWRQQRSRVKVLLFGSRDLRHWQLVAASAGERMQGLSGTPFKWFRIALVLNLSGNESITGASVEVDTRYTNHLR